jgi:hypothetical protein
MARTFSVCLCALLVLLWVGQQAVANEKPAPPPPGAVPVQTEEKADDGATVKQVAAGTGTLLKPVEHQNIVLPTAVAERITEQTALFYFSPTCSHCQAVMPEINRLVNDGSMKWLGIASSRSTSFEVQAFTDDYTPEFEIIMDDEESSFARAVQARSTPSVYVVHPHTSEADTAVDGTVELAEIYAPYHRGMAGIFSIRSHPEDPFKDFGTHQGLQVCGSCHTQESRSWVMTHHSMAYRTLYIRERAQDLQCVGCHVTGLGDEEGFVVGDHGSPMRDVTCESCHGAGGPHNPQRDVHVDPKQECVQCHDAEHSIAFSVEKGLPYIDHFMGNSLSDIEIREQIVAMGNGETPRPLLAFPEGPTAGSAACKSCHKSNHKKWKGKTHGKAMESLDGPDAEQVACVRCHATPASYGPTELTSVGEYRTDESVGCEACHGAGGEHVKQPSKENIVGLGESCPECVIEAICTSCHTPKWDPSWDLKTRLDAIHH